MMSQHRRAIRGIEAMSEIGSRHSHSRQSEGRHRIRKLKHS